MAVMRSSLYLTWLAVYRERWIEVNLTKQNECNKLRRGFDDVRAWARGIRPSQGEWGLKAWKNRLIGGLLARKLVPEARVELARRETTVFETAASAIPPLGHISLHSITEACKRVHEKIASRPALLFRTPHPAVCPHPPRLPALPACSPPRAVRPCAPRARVASALVQLPSSFHESHDCGLFAGCALG